MHFFRKRRGRHPSLSCWQHSQCPPGGSWPFGHRAHHQCHLQVDVPRPSRPFPAKLRQLPQECSAGASLAVGTLCQQGWGPTWDAGQESVGLPQLCKRGLLWSLWKCSSLVLCIWGKDSKWGTGVGPVRLGGGEGWEAHVLAHGTDMLGLHGSLLLGWLPKPRDAWSLELCSPKNAKPRCAGQQMVPSSMFCEA